MYPRGVKKIINDLTNPKMAWHELLNGQIKSYIKDDFTFSPIQIERVLTKAFIWSGLDTQEEIDVTCMIDTSWFIYDEMLRDSWSNQRHNVGVLNFKLNVACFDTECYEMKTFTSFNIDEIDEFELEGGGGTEFDCFLDKMKEDPCVQQVGCVPDGYPGAVGETTHTVTLFGLYTVADTVILLLRHPWNEH